MASHNWYESVVPDDAMPSADIDTSVPHVARVYDYLLGGKDNFAADRKAAEGFIASIPGTRDTIRAQRAFLARAVRYLVTEAGIRQFLDIGTGLPSANNTHEVAQKLAAQSRVVYVDNDPTVLAHAHALLVGTPEGATAYLDADLREVDTILREAARTLDFGKPLAVMMLGILHCIPDEDDPGGIVARLTAAMPPGSYLVIAHPAKDVIAQVRKATQDYNKAAREPLTVRTHAEVCRFFEGLDLVEPGVVQVHRWRPGAGGPQAGRDLPNHAGVGRKPGSAEPDSR